MTLAERLLLALSRSPDSGDYGSARNEWSLETALSLFEREIPGFQAIVAGRRILDFGCGEGYQCVALAKRYNCTVVGIESNPNSLARALDLARREGVHTDRLEFAPSVTASMSGGFDLVVSQNSFEHFGDPAGILGLMQSLIGPHGKILLTFGPPWFAPYGSHMHFFCRWPWINILFSERTVMNVRRKFRKDGAQTYEQVESGLNKMTVARFERLLAESGWRVEYRHYRCIKGWDALSALPFVRELLINHVTVVISRPH